MVNYTLRFSVSDFNWDLYLEFSGLVFNLKSIILDKCISGSTEMLFKK